MNGGVVGMIMPLRSKTWRSAPIFPFASALGSVGRVPSLRYGRDGGSGCAVGRNEPEAPETSSGRQHGKPDPLRSALPEATTAPEGPALRHTETSGNRKEAGRMTFNINTCNE